MCDQGASWAGPEYREQVRLTPAMLKKLSSDLDRVLVFRKATGVQVVINEFGVGTELAVPEDVTAYLAYLTAYCEENDLAWTYMGYYLGSDVGRRTLKPSKQAVLDGLFRNNVDKTETKGS